MEARERRDHMRREVAEQRVRYDSFQEARGLIRTEARACPRTVLGQRCRIVACTCTEWQQRFRVWDHVAMWREPGTRNYVLTLEPYLSSDSAQVSNFVDAVALDGFHVEVSPDSPWNPGATVLLVISKA